MTLGLTHDLFGRKCLIKTGYSERDFVYRIIRSGVSSNGWSEVPLTYQTETNPTVHETLESVLYVIMDTLIDEKSRIIRVAEKDVKLLENNK